MAKKQGAIFSKSLFGYKCSDVNNYILYTDQKHVDELDCLKKENALLNERLIQSEAKNMELSAALQAERSAFDVKLKNKTLEYKQELETLSSVQNGIREKLAESEMRASSYLKMADASAMRADSAEAELSILTAVLEDSKAEIKTLQSDLAKKDKEIRRISEIETLAKTIINQDLRKETNKNSKGSLIKFPWISKRNR